MKKFLSCLFIICLLFTTIPSFAVNAVNTPIETQEFNQWDRSYNDFEFNVSTTKKTEKALSSALITAATASIGSLGGEKGAIAGGAIGAALSSYVSDCIEESYEKFGKVGYGTIIAGRYHSKLRMGVYIYSDPARKNLIYYNTYKSNSFPI